MFYTKKNYLCVSYPVLLG